MIFRYLTVFEYSKFHTTFHVFIKFSALKFTTVMLLRTYIGNNGAVRKFYSLHDVPIFESLCIFFSYAFYWKKSRRYDGNIVDSLGYWAQFCYSTSDVQDERKVSNCGAFSGDGGSIFICWTFSTLSRGKEEIYREMITSYNVHIILHIILSNWRLSLK